MTKMKMNLKLKKVVMMMMITRMRGGAAVDDREGDTMVLQKQPVAAVKTQSRCLQRWPCSCTCPGLSDVNMPSNVILVFMTHQPTTMVMIRLDAHR